MEAKRPETCTHDFPAAPSDVAERLERAASRFPVKRTDKDGHELELPPARVVRVGKGSQAFVRCHYCPGCGAPWPK